ncbi:hypothetical protein HNO88_002779 [Novosphingobium chloroacetimidivorans]|uniref:Uncharacterized protein n=1 Tax=Novosphingobium chloroacetimidivorans TaxID=1428314 RepID=A0A7W7KAX9_9SPHN|nr:hypothetical protein [Novosphingobium chloroacetimidivorans]MBB4859450.1 hypothetical protein [Novosphingobium chloroacetimidivorans]
MTNDVLRAIAYANGLVLTGCTAVALMPLVPLPLDVALGTVAASTFSVTGWLAAFTARAVARALKDSQ